MEQSQKNKAFFLEYINALSASPDKSTELLKKYIDDEKLVSTFASLKVHFHIMNYLLMRLPVKITGS